MKIIFTLFFVTSFKCLSADFNCLLGLLSSKDLTSISKEGSHLFEKVTETADKEYNLGTGKVIFRVNLGPNAKDDARLFDGAAKYLKLYHKKLSKKFGYFPYIYIEFDKNLDKRGSSDGGSFAGNKIQIDINKHKADNAEAYYNLPQYIALLIGHEIAHRFWSDELYRLRSKVSFLGRKYANLQLELKLKNNLVSLNNFEVKEQFSEALRDKSVIDYRKRLEKMGVLKQFDNVDSFKRKYERDYFIYNSIMEIFCDVVANSIFEESSSELNEYNTSQMLDNLFGRNEVTMYRSFVAGFAEKEDFKLAGSLPGAVSQHYHVALRELRKAVWVRFKKGEDFLGIAFKLIDTFRYSATTSFQLKNRGKIAIIKSSNRSDFYSEKRKESVEKVDKLLSEYFLDL